MTKSVYGGSKSQKTLPLDVKVWTVASAATRKANQSIAERNQRRTASSRKIVIPTRNTQRNVAHRRSASLVSMTYAVQPVETDPTPRRRTTARWARQRPEAQGGAARPQQRRAQIFRPERRLPASTREPTASGSRKRRPRRRLRALFDIGPTAAHNTPATPPRALECRPL